MMGQKGPKSMEWYRKEIAGVKGRCNSSELEWMGSLRSYYLAIQGKYAIRLNNATDQQQILKAKGSVRSGDRDMGKGK